MICISNYNIINLINYANMTVISKIKLKNENITCTSLSKDDQILFCGTTKANVYLIAITQESLDLTSHAIFWNHSCRGHACTHPGSIIFLSVCELNKTLYIAFSNGIFSQWSLFDKEPEKVINACERFFSCCMISQNIIAVGCSDSSILTYDLKQENFSRTRFSDDFKTTGCVWKILSTFDENIGDYFNMFACCGGRSQFEDDGVGLTVCQKDKKILLSSEAVIGAAFYVNINQICVVALFEDRLITYIFNHDISSFEINENFFKIDRITDIQSVCSIEFQYLSSVLTKYLFQTCTKLFPAFEHPSITGLECDILLFVGIKSGLIKTFILTLSGVYFLFETCLHENRVPQEMKYLNNNELLLIQSDNSIFAKLWMVYKRLFLHSGSLYLIKKEWELEEKYSIKSLVNKGKKSKNIFSKKKKNKIFNSSIKRKEIKNLPDDVFINFATKISLYHDNIDFNCLFFQLSSGMLLAYVFQTVDTVHALEPLCEIKSPILEVVFYTPKISQESSASDNSFGHILIVLSSEIMICQLNNFCLLHIIKRSQSIDHTRFCHIFNYDLFNLNSDQSVSCYSLIDYLPKFHLYITPKEFSDLRFMSDPNSVQLICSNDSQIAWISLAPDISAIYGLFKQKPMNLVQLAYKEKNIVSQSIADSISTSAIQSELIIHAKERKEKLNKAVEETEKLRASASHFNQTADHIL
ncbi:hypothetical protein HZS_410, partial [Henneguya salminicola]